MDIHEMMQKAVQLGASDIHLVANMPPYLRVGQKLRPLSDRKLSAFEVEGIVYSMMNEVQKEQFIMTWSWTSPSNLRVRGASGSTCTGRWAKSAAHAGTYLP
ncbi:MAG TPA: hypothetical protein PLW63_07455 [Bacillota bacterium]|nr:hypothetical protein [Bacillota bacterium]